MDKAGKLKEETLCGLTNIGFGREWGYHMSVGKYICAVCADRGKYTKDLEHNMQNKPFSPQAIYEILLKDDRLRCTCDEVVREEKFHQAQGHYHHCMLYQVTRAIEISLKYCDGYRLVNGKIVKTNGTEKSHV